MRIEGPLPDHNRFYDRFRRQLRTRLAVTLARLLGVRDEKSIHVVYYRDKPLVILPTVFDPMRHWSGELLADNLVIEEGDTVLDMGTGSGIQAIAAAAKASQVLACDINPMAVKCAGVNALLNELDSRIECRVSDLFDSVRPEEKFDLIIFNTPFFFVDPKNPWEEAYLGGSNGEVIRGFWAGVKQHLTPTGKVQVIFSSTVAPFMFEFEEFRETGLKPSLVVERKSLSRHCVSVYLAAQ